MKYQDTWLNGEMIEKGKRDCESRYKIIKSVAEELRQNFNVIDIGANMGYFDIRLVEDFNCTILAYEYDHFDMRFKHIERTGLTENIFFERKKINLAHLKFLNLTHHFDLCLAASVLHHMHEDIQLIIEQLRLLSDYTIIEFALDDSKRTGTRKNYFIPSDGKILGYGDSHLNDKIKRPIILFKNI